MPRKVKPTSNIQLPLISSVIPLPTVCLSILALAVSNAYASLPTQEEQALMDFYNATQGSVWGENRGWMLSQLTSACRTFKGITCATTYADFKQNVIGTTLETEALYDALPNNVVEFETKSSTLFPVKGSLPASFSNLTQLKRINLGASGLYGALPDLSTLTQLSYVDLRWNGFNNEFPAWLSQLTALETLLLSYNRFTGSLPEDIGNLTKLKEFAVDANRLTGPVPDSIMNLSTLSFGALALQYNALTLQDDILATWINQRSPAYIPAQTIDVRQVEMADITDLVKLEAGNDVLVQFSFPWLSSGMPQLQYQNGCDAPVTVPPTQAFFKDAIGPDAPYFESADNGEREGGAASNTIVTKFIRNMKPGCAYQFRVIMVREGIDPDSPPPNGFLPSMASFRTAGSDATILDLSGNSNTTSTPVQTDDRSTTTSGGGGGGGGGSLSWALLSALCAGLGWRRR